MCAGGDVHGKGQAWGAYVAGGMHGRGMHGGGHAWQGHAWPGGMHSGGMHGRGHVWQGGVHGSGGCAWHTVNEWAVRILLECILVTLVLFVQLLSSYHCGYSADILSLHRQYIFFPICEQNLTFNENLLSMSDILLKRTEYKTNHFAKFNEFCMASKNCLKSLNDFRDALSRLTVVSNC